MTIAPQCQNGNWFDHKMPSISARPAHLLRIPRCLSTGHNALSRPFVSWFRGVHSGLPASGGVKKRQRSLSKLGRGVEEYRPMASVGNDPESGARNSAVHLHRHLHRIEQIAIAMDDQG